jgi:hypothetical protein
MCYYAITLRSNAIALPLIFFDMKIKAQYLAALLVELISNDEYGNNWHLEKLKPNTYSHNRLLKIDALIQAFMPDVYYQNDLAGTIQNIREGKFIYARKLEDYKNLLAVMDKKIESQNIPSNEHDNWSLDLIQFNFKQLLDFKLMVNAVTKFNSGIMEISYLYFYAYTTSQAVIDRIRTKEIDKFLALVLDPESRWFTQVELVKHFGFPVELAEEDDYI